MMLGRCSLWREMNRGEEWFCGAGYEKAGKMRKGERMKRELRRSERYLTREGAIGAFFPTEPDDFLRVGRIVDISEEGVGLRYFAKAGDTRPPTHMDIFGSCHPLIYIGNIPSQVVYDREVLALPGSTLRVRRCGVKFGRLSKKQASHLRHFMRNYVANAEWKRNETGCWTRKVELMDIKELTLQHTTTLPGVTGPSLVAADVG